MSTTLMHDIMERVLRAELGPKLAGECQIKFLSRDDGELLLDTFHPESNKAISIPVQQVAGMTVDEFSERMVVPAVDMLKQAIAKAA
jgi:hypothetical protein